MYRDASLLLAGTLLSTFTLGCEGESSENLSDVPLAQMSAALSQSRTADSWTDCFKISDDHPGSGTAGEGSSDTTELHRPWPCNGYVVNNYSAAVNVWDDDHKYYTIAAHSTSDRFRDDVDFILSPCTGTWLKIGPLDVTVNSSGCVIGYWSVESPPK
jgi:hypothetical protein